MKLKVAVIVLLTINLLLSIAAVGSAFSIPDTIYIRPDGSVNPQTAPISQSGNTYTITGDLTSQVVIECNNIVFDGAGHSIRGDDWGVALNLTCMNVLVKNVHLEGWQAGVLGAFNNNTIRECSITGCEDAFKIYAQYYVIVGNNVENNDEAVRVGMGGLHYIAGNNFVNNKIGFALYDADNVIIQNNIINCSEAAFRLDNQGWTQTIYHNNFVGHAKSVSDFTYSNSIERPVQSQIQSWDNGVSGNYWSDYNGTDGNSDGVGDSPMQISTYYQGELLAFYSYQDRYPLTSQYNINLPIPPIPQALIPPPTTPVVDNRDKALSFLADVLGFNLTHYQPALDSNIYGFDASTVTQSMQYTLKENSENAFFVNLRFTNTSLIYCDLSIPHLSEWRFLDSYDSSVSIMENYHAWTNDPAIGVMVNQLAAAGSAKNLTETSSNISFVMQADSQQATCKWNYNYAGVDYSGVTLVIANYSQAYHPFHFEDNRAVNKIGDTHIGITEAQAKAIAQEYVKNSFTYAKNSGNGSTQFINGLNPIDQSTTLCLETQNRYDSTLYPCWNIHVVLDQVYPGRVTAVNVKVWADDGAVYSARTESAYNPDWRYDPPPLLFGLSSFVISLLLLVIITGVVVVFVLVLVLKKTDAPQVPKPFS